MWDDIIKNSIGQGSRGAANYTIKTLKKNIMKHTPKHPNGVVIYSWSFKHKGVKYGKIGYEDLKACEKAFDLKRISIGLEPLYVLKKK